MKVAATYSHLNGMEWLLVRRPGMWRELENVIASIDAEAQRTKQSREARKKGRGALYSPIRLYSAFKELLSDKQWKEVKTTYWVTDDFHLIRQTIPLPPAEQKRKIEERS